MPRLRTAFSVTLLCSGAVLAGGAGEAAQAPTGCAPSFVRPSPVVLSRDLAAAERRWRASGLQTYSFTFEQTAQPVRYPATRIEVTGRTVRATPSGEGDASAFAHGASVEGLFGFIRQGAAYARTSPCTELKVRYAPDGHPLSYASDLRLVNIADGGASWTVRGFRRR